MIKILVLLVVSHKPILYRKRLPNKMNLLKTLQKRRIPYNTYQMKKKRKRMRLKMNIKTTAILKTQTTEIPLILRALAIRS